ncbi:MAG: hypothetical protein NDJ89_10920 [Oligoflexia bacterium]|nr:hypothetical protein [Oligoflexia bacterium]
MHPTLKREVCTPPTSTLQYQEIKFERFRKQFKMRNVHMKESLIAFPKTSTRHRPGSIPPI